MAENLSKVKSPILTPVIAFGLCLALTVGGTFFAFLSAQNENAGRFERSIGAFQDTLKNRMTIYTNAIVYTRNLFNVKPNLTEHEFHDFVARMHLRENYPGIQTLGYVQKMSLGQARSFLHHIGESEQASGLDHETSDDAEIVRYVEILNPQSAHVLGLDLSASAARRQAMDEARDSGEPVASDHTVPMQAGTPRSVYAFLVFVPLYRPGVPLETVAERRAALTGFVFSGFRAPNLFGKITEDARFRHAEFIVRIYDGPTEDPATLMYAEGPDVIEDPLMDQRFKFEFAKHVWTLRVIAPQSFSVPALRWLPGFVFSLGLLLSAMLALALRRSQSLASRLSEDIRVREETEKLLSAARTEAEQANRAKSIFLANISHEIRTPLGVMLGFSEMALTQTDAREREESLRTVIRNGRELTRIIGDVLDVSKIEAQSLKIEEVPFSLGGMIHDVIQIWKPQIEAKGVRFVADIAADLPREISSDETRLKQVLTNLLSNALKFTSAGAVTLSARSAATPDGRISLSFAVADSGIGISDAQRERLFKPFSQGDSSITRKYGGSGLGLALSRAIAETLGGSLELSRSSSGGAEFTFTVPVKTASLPVAAAPVDVASLKGRRVLLVDDSPDNRALLSLMLKKAEASVDVAVDGDDGVQKALKRSYDLILMDIQMPNKDGYTALRELRNEHGLRVPVIALTAHALREERDRALSEGFAGYITKPVDRETLVRVSAETLA